MKRKVIMLIALVCAIAVQAAEQFVCFEKRDGAVSITNAAICYSEQEWEGVKIAARNLQNDMLMVLGNKPQLTENAADATILVGTVGKNKEIDKLMLKQLQGKREQFIITTVGNKVIVAGSDKRGTIYGIYELSRQLGVSPWYWWADAPIEKHKEAYVANGTFTDGEPAVEFRGLFLNDEAPCLTTWVKNTFGTNYGGHSSTRRCLN